MRTLMIAFTFLIIIPQAQSVDFAGVHISDQITAENGEVLQLNGIGLREKYWVDIYVGSLYLARKSNRVAEILSAPNALRLQMDFIYKEVDKDQLLDAWRDGFDKNQDSQTLTALNSRIEQLYSYFQQNAVEKDRYVLDYIPRKGTTVTKNKTVLGVIPGEDFKNALLEIWLGNAPADSNLKKGILGL